MRANPMSSCDAEGVGSIGFFLAVLSVVGLVLWLIHWSDEMTVVAFAVITFVWSLSFPLVGGPLSTGRVDFWYYTFAGVGVVLIFLDSSADRQRLISLEERARLSEKLKQVSRNLDDLLARRAEVATVIGHPMKMFERIRNAAVSPESVKRIGSRVKDCEAVNADLDKQQFQQHLRNLRNSVPYNSSIPKVLGPIQLPLSDCSQIQENWMKISTAVNKAGHPKEIIALMRDNNSISDVAGAGLNFGTLSFKELINYLDRGWDSESAAGLLDSEVQELETERRDLMKRVAEPIPDPKLERTTAAVVRQFLWTYVLLSALALKLARRAYLKQWMGT
jgi:chorismate mutase